MVMSDADGVVLRACQKWKNVGEPNEIVSQS